MRHQEFQILAVDTKAYRRHHPVKWAALMGPLSLSAGGRVPGSVRCRERSLVLYATVQCLSSSMRSISGVSGFFCVCPHVVLRGWGF